MVFETTSIYFNALYEFRYHQYAEKFEILEATVKKATKRRGNNLYFLLSVTKHQTKYSIIHKERFMEEHVGLLKRSHQKQHIN